MLVLSRLAKSQSSLFDAPVTIHQSIRKDGTVVKQHIAIRKVLLPKPHQDMLFGHAAEPSPPVRASKLDAFVAKHGGAKALAATIAAMTPAQRESMHTAMAKLDGGTVESVRAMLGAPAPAVALASETDLFTQPEAKEVPAHVPEPEEVGEEARATSAPKAEEKPGSPWGAPAGASKAERRAINARVVALVGRDAESYSDDDKALLRQYSGNGGCGDSLNEFYTDPGVARAMWSAIEAMGITSGTALEPSCATGVFLHEAPAGFKVTGVEMDPISQACAKALHGERHEIVEPTSLERFARADGGRQFDVVIGNPPYGPRGSMAKDDKKYLKEAERYFIDTSLDKCKPGGIVALVVPSGVLSSKNGRMFREHCLRKAEFLGAQRLPNSAFEASHTDVTTDILYFRKRGDDVSGALGQVNQTVLKKLGVWDDEWLAGDYFKGRGARNLYGVEGTSMRAFGEIYAVTGSMEGVAEQVAHFQPDSISATPTARDVFNALEDDPEALKRAMGAAMVRPYANGKAGDTKVEDGITYVLQGKPLRWHRVDELMQTDAVSDAIPIAEQIERAMTGQTVDHAALTASVEAYVAKHGSPEKALTEAAQHNKKLFRLIGAVDGNGALSDLVTGRQASKLEGSLETAATTLVAETAAGTFTAAELAQRTGKEAAEVEETLHASTAYAYAGDGQWTTMADYLTGELWPKLDAARAAMKGAGDLAPKLEMQVVRLTETINPKALEDVDIAVNSAFLPLDVVAEYFNDKKRNGNKWEKEQPDVVITFDKGLYTVTGGNQYGEQKLLSKYLNRLGVEKKEIPEIDAMNDGFKDWLLTSRYREQIEDLYNRKFKGYAAKAYSDAPIEIPGLGKEGVNAYHFSSLRWAMQAGKGIIADDVGLGKTGRGLMLARLAKLSGKAKKPTFIVPKSVMANWVAEAESWFPGSRVLTIGETYSRTATGELKSRADTAAERDRKMHELMQNDYDFIFISQSAFNTIDLDPITKGEAIEQDFWTQRGDAINAKKKADGKTTNAGEKRIRKIRVAYEQAVANREFDRHTQAGYFNQLGIDMMIVDEAANYKNLYAARNRFGESPLFLGGSGLSNTALDMNLKSRWLLENNGGKGIYHLTATPTKNSPLEVYSMLSHICPEEFERIGVRNAEEFLDRFCEFKMDQALTLDGTIGEHLITSGFKNLDELREIMGRYIMRRTAADVGLALPKREDHQHLIDMSPKQAAVYGELRALLEESQAERDATGESHVFSIMSKMGKAAVDLRLLDEAAYAGESSPRYVAAAKEIVAGLKEGGQVVFCEAVPSHKWIADALVKAGIPRERIAIFNAEEAETSAKRQNISDGFNAGLYDVVIGNKTMQEGVNLQKRTADIHHFDLPWEPAAMQQRNGRGLRQGNRNAGVGIHTYLMRGSFDGMRYQSMMAKKDWQDILWHGGDRVENLAREGTFSRDEIRIMMSADPDAEREKYKNDKAAAAERDAAGKRVDAAAQFVRFQSLSRSFRELKNKDSATAARLSTRIQQARNSLASNPHFKAKGALDSNEEVLIHPATGDIVQRNQGYHVTEADGSTTSWVITGVNTKANTVSMRPYADTTGHKGVTVPSTKMVEGVEPFQFDATREAETVEKTLIEKASSDLKSIKSYEAVRKMPTAVVERNADMIQAALKEGAKGYGLDFGHGMVPMVNKSTGAIEMKASYEHRTAHETHDYLLPTSEAKDKLMQAWMDAERAATFGTEFQHVGNKRSTRSNTLARKKYKGAKYDAKHINPISEALTAVNGESFSSYAGDTKSIKAARAKLEIEQLDKLRHAPTLAAAMQAAMPLGEAAGGVTHGTHFVRYPHKVLAMLWAKARQFGVLGDEIGKHAEKTGGSYGDVKVHNDYAYGGHSKASTHAALMTMAAESGHPELTTAMASAAVRHGIEPSAKETAQKLYPQVIKLSREARAPMKAELLTAMKRAGMMDSSVGELKGTTSYDYFPDRDMPAGKYVEEHL